MSRFQKRTKARNWTDEETVLFCKILADPANNYIEILETKALKKAPTREVFDEIMQVFTDELGKKYFMMENSRNFHSKRPPTELDIDIKKLQSKYNNIKSKWKHVAEKGLPLEKLPRWFKIINKTLSTKYQSLDDVDVIAIPLKLEDGILGVDSEFEVSGDEEERLDESILGTNDMYTGTPTREGLPQNIIDINDIENVAEVIVPVLANVVNGHGLKNPSKPHERNEVREQSSLSQIQALNRLASSITRLADVQAKQIKSQKEQHEAWLSFQREEAEANRRHELEVAQLFCMRRNRNAITPPFPKPRDNAFSPPEHVATQPSSLTDVFIPSFITTASYRSSSLQSADREPSVTSNSGGRTPPDSMYDMYKYNVRKR